MEEPGFLFSPSVTPSRTFCVNPSVLRFLRRPFVRRVFPAVPRAWLRCVTDEIGYAHLVAAVHGGGRLPEDRFFGRDLESRASIPEHEERILRAAGDAFRAASAVSDAGLPVPYQAGEEWRKYLQSGWRRYRDAVHRGNYGEVAPLLRNFFRNEGIAGIWADQEVFATFRDLRGAAALFSAGQMMRQYLVWRELCPDVDVRELDAPAIGNPWGYRFGPSLVYQPAFEYHFQARQLRSLLEDRPNPVVLEIGGGFGGLAYHLRRALPAVKYVGFDLPENLLVQDYYLSAAFPAARVLRYARDLTSLPRSVLADYDIVLLPNFLLPRVESGLADLVVNVRSLSEMSAETIAEYFHQLSRLVRRYFLHENLSGPRGDGYFGIPCDRFPPLPGFIRVASHESRWPRYQRDSAYPCREELFLRSDPG